VLTWKLAFQQHFKLAPEFEHHVRISGERSLELRQHLGIITSAGLEGCLAIRLTNGVRVLREITAAIAGIGADAGSARSTVSFPVFQRLLDQFVDLDMPFNLEERQNRISMLRTNMDSSELTISEKFRQIMSAYQVETSFGKDTEATVGILDIGGEAREVNFLRVGRILLAYQTPDRQETGFWNKNTRQWEGLGDEYRKPISEGLRIANKQAAPDLLKLPVPAPENAQ